MRKGLVIISPFILDYCGNNMIHLHMYSEIFADNINIWVCIIQVCFLLFKEPGPSMCTIILSYTTWHYVDKYSIHYYTGIGTVKQ